MSHPILVTGAADGRQGSTGRLIAGLLLEQGIPVRALVHKLDSRSDELRQQSAEVIEGDLLNPASVLGAIRNVKRAYFTYPVADRLLEAATIFAASARDAALELVVNNSQYQGRAGAVKEQFGPHALDHLWQNFRKGEDAIRMVTGRAPQTLEEFFREKSEFFAVSTQEA